MGLVASLLAEKPWELVSSVPCPSLGTYHRMAECCREMNNERSRDFSTPTNVKGVRAALGQCSIVLFSTKSSGLCLTCDDNS